MKLDEIQNISDNKIRIPQHLFASVSFADITDKEKATKLIEMHTNMLVAGGPTISFEYAVGHTQGLITGCSMGGLITKDEEKLFQERVSARRRAFYKKSEKR